MLYIYIQYIKYVCTNQLRATRNGTMVKIFFINMNIEKCIEAKIKPYMFGVQWMAVMVCMIYKFCMVIKFVEFSLYVYIIYSYSPYTDNACLQYASVLGNSYTIFYYNLNIFFITNVAPSLGYNSRTFTCICLFL